MNYILDGRIRQSIRLPLKNGNRMRLEGFIDRVDVCEEEDRVLLRIIDYKSGNQTFDLNELYHGLQMQLVVYMNVATEIYQKENRQNRWCRPGCFIME